MHRPGLYHGENPRAEVMAWMDYADALEADLKSATNSYREALRTIETLEKTLTLTRTFRGL